MERKYKDIKLDIMLQQVRASLLGKVAECVKEHQSGKVKYFLRGSEVQKEWVPRRAPKNPGETIISRTMMRNITKLVEATIVNLWEQEPMEIGYLYIQFSVDAEGNVDTDVEFEQESHFKRW
ncbi:hypothetical protein [Niallia taxi]|uniref:hypothetical protein n=1 Tax=Niallia taxi TaxID=2499688 RepID=UPI0015F6BD8E|nr:hypothetical protein [Niallia taxi]